MHELSLAESLIETIEAASLKQNFTRVRTVWLEAGKLSGVEPEALQFGFQSASQGTVAEGAVLEISEPPGEAWCEGCNTAIIIMAYYDPCPHCHGHRLRITGGEQFRLKELEVI